MTFRQITIAFFTVVSGTALLAGPEEQRLYEAARHAFDASSIPAVGADIPADGLFVAGITGRCFTWTPEEGYTVGAAGDVTVRKVVVEDPVLHIQLEHWTLDGHRANSSGSRDFGYSHLIQYGPGFYTDDRLILRKAAKDSSATWWTRYSFWWADIHELRKRRYCYYR